MQPLSLAGYFQKALNASGIGTWQYDTATTELFLDETAQKLFGLFSGIIKITDLFADNGDVLRLFNKSNFDHSFIAKNGNLLHLKGERTAEGVTAGTVQADYAPDYSTLGAVIAQSPIAMGLYTGEELTVSIANDIMLSFWGRDSNVIGLSLEDAVPELQGQPFVQILKDIFTNGETYAVTDAPARLALDGVLDTYYFDFTYKPLFDKEDQVYAILNTAINVTDRVLTKQRNNESEVRFRYVTEQSPVAIGFLYGKDMVVEIANERILEIWGKGQSIIGLPIIRAIPEIEGQGFLELLDNVYTTGETFRGYEILVKLVHNNELTDIYVDFTYSALRDNEGTITGVLVLANDVTRRVTSMRELAASEEKFRSVIYSAQAAMAVFTGPDLVADIANDAFCQFVGRDRENFVGLPILESVPELAGQKSIELMRSVYDNGTQTHHYGRQVDIIRNGALTQNYYNVSYTPLRNADGTIYGVLDIAIDVTETVKAQQAQNEAEASLRGAIELAELGTWSLNPITDEVLYSQRMLEWFGFDGEPEAFSDIVNIIHPDDRDKVNKAVMAALAQGSDGMYDEEYTVINRITGVERVLHAQGRAFFDANGKSYLISGTAQDITAQKKIQLALENEVKARTAQLKNINLELEDANQRLINSNEELAQYAYVASHDLQEPLRKISMFSNLLNERDTDKKFTGTINKIIHSSERMSLLIRDLLEFSRLLHPDTRFIPTNLEEIASVVKTDFELVIEEKKAVIQISSLPTIDAIPLQMNQLFYNLIGNALKFIPADRKPLIKISCSVVQPSEVREHITHPLNAPYFKISISDNGIGIPEKYQKQIFEVFKRLHTRTEYSGSGIGLAICRRITNNHNGAIYIQSAEGEGTTFNILLPERQV